MEALERYCGFKALGDRQLMIRPLPVPCAISRAPEHEFFLAPGGLWIEENALQGHQGISLSNSDEQSRPIDGRRAWP